MLWENHPLLCWKICPGNTEKTIAKKRHCSTRMREPLFWTQKRLIFSQHESYMSNEIVFYNSRRIFRLWAEFQLEKSECMVLRDLSAWDTPHIALLTGWVMNENIIIRYKTPTWFPSELIDLSNSKSKKCNQIESQTQPHIHFPYFLLLNANL